MKKLIVLGLTVAVVTFGGAAFAADDDGGTLQERELQKLFEWSAQAVQATETGMRVAGPAAKPAYEVPPVLEYQGSGIR